MKILINRLGFKEEIEISDDLLSIDLVTDDGTVFSIQPKAGPYIEILCYSRGSTTLVIEPRSSNAIRLRAAE